MNERYVCMFVLIMALACTKSSTDNTNNKVKMASVPSSTVDAQSSFHESRVLDQIALAEALKQTIKSAGVSTLSSSAFSSVCPSTLSTQSTSKCLYYRDKNDVYQLCFPTKTKKFVFSIEKAHLPSEKIEEPFKASSGHLVWKAGEGLFVWDGTNLRSVQDAGYVTSFLISPDGQCLAWNTNWRTTSSDGDEEYFFDSEDKANIVFASKIRSQDRKEVYKQTYRVDNLGADHREEKKLLAWSKVNPSILYLTTKFERQLYSGYQGIKAIDFSSGEEENLGEVEEFLAFTNDEKKVAYTPNDITCCGGSNYTNNTVIISDVETDKSITIYDEWKEFGNKGKEEEYIPLKAAFSPDGSRIAISIDGSKVLVTIRKVDGSGDSINLPDRFIIGWLDQNSLILGKTVISDDRQMDKVQDVYIYNLKNGKEESLSLNDVTYLAFE